MKNVYVTVYTKEQGRLDLNKQEYNNFNFESVIKHRTDGPAVIYYYENGSVWHESYYINNKLHKEDGPAAIWYYRYGSVWREYYYINDKCHRIDGPAAIWYYKDGSVESEEYYINGKKYKKEDYDNLINEIKALPKSLRLIHKDWWVREL